MKIKTERLILRPLEDRDAEDIVVNLNDLAVSRWMAKVPFPYTLRHARDHIRKNQKRWAKRVKDDYTFGIELAEPGKLIGAMGIHRIDLFNSSGTLGYYLGRPYQQNGYGSEALAAVLDFAFQRLKLRRLDAMVYTDNPGSGKLLEKFGFDKVGEIREGQKCKANGKIHDEYIYWLLRKDYKTHK